MAGQKPNLELQYLSLTDLLPYARNSRTHSDEQVAQIAASIKEFGFCNPVLIDAERTIIAGHGRVLAAHKLGLTQVPTITLGHLTDTQRRAYVIADNRLALNAGWDMSLLSLEFEDLQSEEFDLSKLGFENDEVHRLLNGSATLSPEEGSKELTEEGFSKFDHACPKCGFEFDT